MRTPPELFNGESISDRVSVDVDGRRCAGRYVELDEPRELFLDDHLSQGCLSTEGPNTREVRSEKVVKEVSLSFVQRSRLRLGCLRHERETSRAAWASARECRLTWLAWHWRRRRRING